MAPNDPNSGSACVKSNRKQPRVMSARAAYAGAKGCLGTDSRHGARIPGPEGGWYYNPAQPDERRQRRQPVCHAVYIRFGEDIVYGGDKKLK
jgi:hypothetical protein